MKIVHLLWKNFIIQATKVAFAPVAQLDRALACGAKGRKFESCQVYQRKSVKFLEFGAFSFVLNRNSLNFLLIFRQIWYNWNIGEVAEWLKAHDSKSCMRFPRIGGSNPPLSAMNEK